MDTEALAAPRLGRRLHRQLRSAVDKYTRAVQHTRPQPRFAKDLGVTIWDNRNFYPCPSISGRTEDPTTFEFYPPVCIGQYKFSKTDPNGNWTLWELREDWERTSVGQITEKSGPKYILWNFVGTEEKRILAMIANDVDILQDITPESMQVLTERSDVVRAWHAGFPYADFDDPCERGISFNNSEFPYDQWQVRWALAWRPISRTCRWAPLPACCASRRWVCRRWPPCKTSITSRWSSA
jgi:peptide/nickel transport system substrate-binding protein